MVKLYNGDCIEFMRDFDKQDDIAIVTDPPYGISYSPDWKKWNGSKSDFRKIYGDQQPFNPLPFLKFKKVILFGANYFSDLLPVGSWLVWDKRTNSRLDRMFGSSIEMAWMKTDKPKTEIIRILHGGVVNADSENGNNEKRVHPTQKPVKLIRRIIESFIPEHFIVFDPYMGSGTAGIACVQLGRNFIGCEISTEYFIVAENRINRAELQPSLFQETGTPANNRMNPTTNSGRENWLFN
jgi:site-specific DNA-methyltransferase (adenine-specific)